MYTSVKKRLPTLRPPLLSELLPLLTILPYSELAIGVRYKGKSQSSLNNGGLKVGSRFFYRGITYMFGEGGVICLSDNKCRDNDAAATGD